MTHGRNGDARLGRIGLAAVFAAALTLSTFSTARAQEDAPVNTGAVSLAGGVDFVSQYWFRGIAQENQGFIAQPYIEVGLNMAPVGMDWLDLYGGVWNSIHSNSFIADTTTPPDGTNEGDQTGFFETDWYVGASFALPAGFALDVAYVSLLGPAFGDIFAEEIDITLSFDDSGLWGEPMEGWTGFAPYIMVVRETGGGSDALGPGGELGTYLEFGVAPGFTILPSEDMPVDLTIPVTLGFSLDDYYEDGTGDDEAFGFVDFGAEVSTPLSFMPQEFGSWSAYAGVHAIVLGDSTQEISGPNQFGVIGEDSDVEVYGVFGISMEY